MVFVKLSQGTVVGNFGLGGQETTRIPGARESERLFLVGWEVNIQLGKNKNMNKIKHKRDYINQPAGGDMYYAIVIIIFLLLSLFCYCYYAIVVVLIMLLSSICCCCLFLV
jgi:hypothetical protein